MKSIFIKNSKGEEVEVKAFEKSSGVKYDEDPSTLLGVNWILSLDSDSALKVFRKENSVSPSMTYTATDFTFLGADGLKYLVKADMGTFLVTF